MPRFITASIFWWRWPPRLRRCCGIGSMNRRVSPNGTTSCWYTYTGTTPHRVSGSWSWRGTGCETTPRVWSTMAITSWCCSVDSHTVAPRQVGRSLLQSTHRLNGSFCLAIWGRRVEWRLIHTDPMQTPLMASTTKFKAGSLSARSLNWACLISFKNLTTISHA